jgi:hypothetical protein
MISQNQIEQRSAANPIIFLNPKTRVVEAAAEVLFGDTFLTGHQVLTVVIDRSSSIVEISPFFYPPVSLFSITYEWQRNCDTHRARLNQKNQMLRIQREANGQVVLRISGRLYVENLVELKKLIESEGADRRIVLDLRELRLVDQEAVRFLEQYDSDGIELQNCPPYICEWITRQRDGK